MFRFKEYLEEAMESRLSGSYPTWLQSRLNEGTVAAGGLAYEAKVRKAVEKALKNLKLAKTELYLKPDDAGGFDSTVVDMYLSLKGKDVPIEIKMDKNAQMGGSSVKFDGKNWTLAEKGKKNIEPDTQQLLIAAAKEKVGEYKKLMAHLKTYEPKNLHKTINQIPFRCTKPAWEQAVAAGKLKPTNTTVKFDTRFIHDWYAGKDCYYIQIGKLGLFYLKKNPLNLPVPQLSGEIEIYLRLVRGGAAMMKTGEFKGENVSTVNLRAQGKLKLKGSSSLSLDNIDDCEKIFSNMLGIK